MVRWSSRAILPKISPMPNRRFPPPWRADKMPGGYVVRDAKVGSALKLALNAVVSVAGQSSGLD